MALIPFTPKQTNGAPSTTKNGLIPFTPGQKSPAPAAPKSASGFTPAGIQSVTSDVKGALKLAGQRLMAPLSPKQEMDYATGFAGGDSGAIQDAVEKAPGVISDVAGKIKTAAEDMYKNSSLSDWLKPTTKTAAAYNKATEIFNSAKLIGHNIADTLVGNGVKLSDNIQDGKYSTADTANAMRADAGKTSHDVLRPALEQADYSTPKTPVSTALSDAEKTITNDKKLTAGEKQTALARLKTETTALTQSHPDGMKLVDLHDNKITYSQKAGHNPVGNMDDNVTARVNDAIATALKTTLEKTAPPEIPVKEFNAELSKKYTAADYLDALHTKPVPKSLAQKVAKTTAKVIGAGVGEAIGGGSILGGVGGYHLGGALESSLENMSNPLKSFFLNNLEKSNPEAFQAVKKYLGDAEVSRLTTKSLPAPAEAGSPTNPLPIGGTTKEGYKVSPSGEKTPIESKTEVKPAQKNPVSQNPLTGKFQKTFSSSDVAKEPKPVLVKDAPKGNFLNIGMNVGTTSEKLTKAQMVQKFTGALPEDVKIISSTVQKGADEDTFVPKLSRKLTNSEMEKVLEATQQKAIPQLSDGVGTMHGSNEWGDFSKGFFKGVKWKNALTGKLKN